MHTLKLVFHESKIVTRKDGATESLLFKGFWANNSSEPTVSLSVTGCSDGKANEILQDLQIVYPGEVLFVAQGENPQKRLDYWLVNAVRRKEPKVKDFEIEITDFDTDMLNERKDTLYEELKVLINENKEGTKKFDFLLECFDAIVSKISGVEEITSKEDLIDAVRGIGTAHADVDIDDDWDQEEEEE